MEKPDQGTEVPVDVQIAWAKEKLDGVESEILATLVFDPATLKLLRGYIFAAVELARLERAKFEGGLDLDVKGIADSIFDQEGHLLRS